MKIYWVSHADGASLIDADTLDEAWAIARATRIGVKSVTLVSEDHSGSNIRTSKVNGGRGVSANGVRQVSRRELH
jgi:hypothetical protein